VCFLHPPSSHVQRNFRCVVVPIRGHVDHVMEYVFLALPLLLDQVSRAQSRERVILTKIVMSSTTSSPVLRLRVPDTSELNVKVRQDNKAKEFLIGGLAAISASTITHPVDLIKVRMLLHGEQQKNALPKLSLITSLVKSEGVSGLYAGVSAAWVRQAFFSTTRFGVYDLVKKSFGETKDLKLPFYQKVISTSTAGSIAALVACPAELVMIRMQADGRLPIEQRRGYSGPFNALGRIASEEGLLGLYRGLGPLLVRGVCVTTAQFSTYDQAKEILQNRFQRDDILVQSASGFCAGFVAAVVSTPIDVIKSRMMNSTKAGQHGNSAVMYKSSADCLVQTLANEGVRGLFKGFFPCYMRMGPQVMLMWTFVEQYRTLWDRFTSA
jgi:solute carrier family 25 oxoglutarate transporter 11